MCEPDCKPSSLQLIGGLEHKFYFSIIYGMSSFPLTNSYFSRWLLHHQPDKKWGRISPPIGGLCFGARHWNGERYQQRQERPQQFRHGFSWILPDGGPVDPIVATINGLSMISCPLGLRGMIR